MSKKTTCKKNCQKEPCLGGGTSRQATRVACRLGQIRHVHAATPTPAGLLTGDAVDRRYLWWGLPAGPTPACRWCAKKRNTRVLLSRRVSENNNHTHHGHAGHERSTESSTYLFFSNSLISLVLTYTYLSANGRQGRVTDGSTGTESSASKVGGTLSNMLCPQRKNDAICWRKVADPRRPPTLAPLGRTRAITVQPVAWESTSGVF
jgi:hypothetical protein